MLSLVLFSLWHSPYSDVLSCYQKGFSFSFKISLSQPYQSFLMWDFVCLSLKMSIQFFFFPFLFPCYRYSVDACVIVIISGHCNPSFSALFMLRYVLTFWPGQKCHSRWCTGRKWHILMAVMKGNRVGGNWLMKWDEVKKIPLYFHRLTHRKRVTSELQDSYFCSMTIKHAISKIAEVTHPDRQISEEIAEAWRRVHITAWEFENIRPTNWTEGSTGE